MNHWAYLIALALAMAGCTMPVADSLHQQLDVATSPSLVDAAPQGELSPGTSTAAAADCRTLVRPGSRVARWNPPGQLRVGLQAGHWLTSEAPNELARLRNQTGTTGGGYTEWEVNLMIAEKTASLLREQGIEVDVLPTTIPSCYRAHAFVSIHADGDLTGALRGFKIARPGGSLIPAADDALVAGLYEQYALATELPRDDLHISRRMLNYYAFGVRRQAYGVAADVPSAIIETGFLTNTADRWVLTQSADRVAAGIANGILQSLGIALRVPVA